MLHIIGCIKKKNEGSKNKMVAGVHMGRYMFTMMGFFAVYAGFVYNDCFSLSMNLFWTRYEVPGQFSGETEEGDSASLIAQYGSNESVYPFGIGSCLESD